MQLLKLALCLVGVAGCARAPALRDLGLVANVRYAPREQDVVATVSLTARALPPPVRNPDQALDAPPPGPSDLPRCRSRHDLCRFEEASVARAMAAYRSTSP